MKERIESTAVVSEDLATALGLPAGAEVVDHQTWAALPLARRASVLRLSETGGRLVQVFVALPEPKPALPTEPGSVVLARRVRSESVTGPGAVLLRGQSYWTSWPSLGESESIYHPDEHVEDWVPATVVPTEHLKALLEFVRGQAEADDEDDRLLPDGGAPARALLGLFDGGDS